MKILKWLCIILLLTTGCARLIVTKLWKAENTEPGGFTKILVLQTVRDSSSGAPVDMEDQMTLALKSFGYNAVSSHQEYGAKAFDHMEEATVLHNLKNSGIDAVITITLLHVEKERVHTPDMVYYPPYGDMNRFWLYQTAMYNHIYGPQYYIIDSQYTWESNLYDMATQKLIYAIQTQSFPTGLENFAHKYAYTIVKNMIQQKVLRAGSAPVLKIVTR